MQTAKIILLVFVYIINAASRLQRNIPAVHIFFIHARFLRKNKCCIRIFRCKVKYLFAEMVKMLMARKDIKSAILIPLRQFAVKIVKQQYKLFVTAIKLHRK